MFVEFVEKDEFYFEYLNFFIERFIYSSVSIEKEFTTPGKEETKIELENSKQRLMKNSVTAFKYLIERKERLDYYNIMEVGDIINSDTGITPGFRKIGVLTGSDFSAKNPRSIVPSLVSLLDSYYNIWTDLDVFEKEAMFHIEYMRIHPFEDGNKRSGKIILNSNLCHQDAAPVIITSQDTEEYYNYIINRDYLGFANFLRQRSAIEMNTMVGLYKMMNKIPNEQTGKDLTYYKK
ncbi:MAG: Fic family protein [Bacilli bacterium]